MVADMGTVGYVLLSVSVSLLLLLSCSHISVSDFDFDFGLSFVVMVDAVTGMFVLVVLLDVVVVVG